MRLLEFLKEKYLTIMHKALDAIREGASIRRTIDGDRSGSSSGLQSLCRRKEFAAGLKTGQNSIWQRALTETRTESMRSGPREIIMQW